MKRLLGIVVALVAISSITLTSEARAEHRSHRSSSHSHHSHHSHGRSYSRPSIHFQFGSFGYSSGYRSRSNCYSQSPSWHDTSHYDYHPTEIINHGSHYHVIPGHYDFHRSGHWHY